MWVFWETHQLKYNLRKRLMLIPVFTALITKNAVSHSCHFGCEANNAMRTSYSRFEPKKTKTKTENAEWRCCWADKYMCVGLSPSLTLIRCMNLRVLGHPDWQTNTSYCSIKLSDQMRTALCLGNRRKQAERTRRKKMTRCTATLIPFLLLCFAFLLVQCLLSCLLFLLFYSSIRVPLNIAYRPENAF